MKIDQVGFACPADADTGRPHGDDGRRVLRQRHPRLCDVHRAATRAVSRKWLRVSGCDHIVTAAVDLARGAARAEIPLPRAVRGGGRGSCGHAGRPRRHRPPRDRGASRQARTSSAPPSRCSLPSRGWTPTASFPRTHGHRMTPPRQVTYTGIPSVWEWSCGSGTVPAPSPRVQGLADGLP